MCLSLVSISVDLFTVQGWLELSTESLLLMYRRLLFEVVFTSWLPAMAFVHPSVVARTVMNSSREVIKINNNIYSYTLDHFYYPSQWTVHFVKRSWYYGNNTLSSLSSSKHLKKSMLLKLICHKSWVTDPYVQITKVMNPIQTFYFMWRQKSRMENYRNIKWFMTTVDTKVSLK